MPDLSTPLHTDMLDTFDRRRSPRSLPRRLYRAMNHRGLSSESQRDPKARRERRHSILRHEQGHGTGDASQLRGKHTREDEIHGLDSGLHYPRRGSHYAVAQFSDPVYSLRLRSGMALHVGLGGLAKRKSSSVSPVWMRSMMRRKPGRFWVPPAWSSFHLPAGDLDDLESPSAHASRGSRSLR